MSDRERSLRLLQRISAGTGIDLATFSDVGRPVQSRGGDNPEHSIHAPELLRLVESYLALPTAAARAKVTEMVEALAAQDGSSRSPH